MEKVILSDYFGLDLLEDDVVVSCRKLSRVEVELYLRDFYYVLGCSSMSFRDKYYLLDNLLPEDYKLKDGDLLVVYNNNEWWAVVVYFEVKEKKV